jgi:hypothetical protein
VVVNGKADGLGQLARTELHQPARGERHGRKAEHGGIPAALGDVEGIDQPAIHLIGDDDRGDQLLGTRALGFDNGKTCGDVIARVHRKPDDV